MEQPNSKLERKRDQIASIDRSVIRVGRRCAYLARARVVLIFSFFLSLLLARSTTNVSLSLSNPNLSPRSARRFLFVCLFCFYRLLTLILLSHSLSLSLFQIVTHQIRKYSDRSSLRIACRNSSRRTLLDERYGRWKHLRHR